MNWNPALFKHTYAVHQTWQAGVGPVKDMYDLSLNPQYALEIGPGKGALWILLTRHITDIDDFKNNKVLKPFLSFLFKLNASVTTENVF